ncbi:beta strand repeat-containing protein, partial [Lysobacter hankyongensis]|uniref:beta strand repeat-containing protein n=1 Tax=Lysobacter hankyongensis TaxID=1176535 RepID=UPI0031E50517
MKSYHNQVAAPGESRRRVIGTRAQTRRGGRAKGKHQVLANSTRIAGTTRRSVAAIIVFCLALVASPLAWSQNAVNSATITPPATVTDPNNANNSATDSDAITRTTNLSLVKTASPNPVAVGQLLTYTLTVSNGGPSAILASNTFSIQESLPAGLTGCSFTPSAGTFTVGTIASGATGTGTWTGVAIASGGNATLTIACTVGAAAAASITNTATVIPPTGVSDPDCSGAPISCAGGNTGSVNTTVTRPQLTLTKTASAASFTVGVPASYTLQLTNTGSSATTASSTITDTIPTGLTIGTLPAGCTAAGQTVTCTVASLAAGASTSFVIPITPTAGAAASVTNSATVSGGGDPTCPAAARCTDTEGPTPVNRPVINIAKVAGTATGPSVAGTYTVTYTVTVTNSGAAAGTYGALSDSPVFPASITETGIAWTTSGTGAPPSGSQAGPGAYQLAPAGTSIGAGVTHTFNVTISYVFNANTPPTVCAVTPTPGSGLYNAVSLPIGQENGAAGDNAVCVNSPQPPPQLTLTKTASAASFTVGVPASYTLQVTNSGGVATTAASTITDTIPTGLTIGTLPAGCTAAGQTVTCTIAAGLAAGGSTSFVIPVTPTLAAGTSVTNTATVSGGGDPTCPAAARCTDTEGPTPVNAPQLTLTKTASAASFTIGVPASYTLQVSNTGTAATTAVSTITDTIPTGLTIGTLPAGCTAAGQTVTCTIAAGLAVGGNTSFTIPVTPTEAALPNVTNTATVSGGGDPTCPAAARCTDTEGPTPVNAPQLTLTKTASAASFTVGVPASYTLQVSNTGTAATTAVSTITDTIPTGLTIGTLPAGCTAAGQTVTCTIAAGLAAGGSTSFVIPVTPTLAAGTSVTNTATVSGGGDPTCPAAARCTDTEGPTPVNAPQLTLTKTASAASFTVGVPASYTLQVSNTGTAATTAVSTITDTIPTGLTIGTLPAGCTAAGQTVTCTIAAGLAVGGSTSFVIPVTPTLAAGTSVTNTATVSGGGDPTCPAAARCTDTEGPTPVNAPQLTLTKTASAASFTVGVPASYTLQVSNTGTATTSGNITVTDTIPAGLTIGTLPGGCTAAGQTVTCIFTVALAPGASSSVVIPVTPTLAAGTSVTNTATVSGGGDPTCPAAARCTDTEGPTPVNAPQLTLTKTASAASFTVGVPASYTLQVSNTGTAATTAVSTITDTIPTGLTIGTLPAGCTAAGQTVTCTIAAGLAAGGSTSFVIPVTPTLAAGTSVTNTATVSGGGDPTCPAAARCTDTEGPTPVNAPQLTLTKTASAASFTVGVPASYTLQVSNTGTAATTAVSTITDTIPTGLTIGTLPAGCTAAGQTVTCTVPAGLAAGGSTSFTIPVTPTEAALPNVTNTATVSGGGDPTCPAAARCTDTEGPTPITFTAALTVDKTAAAPSGNTAGSTIAYSFLVTNTGNVTITGIAINDANLDAAAVCPVTTLAPGASTTCTGTHTITQAEVNAGVVNNSATATGTPPGGGTTTSPPDTTSTPIAQTPALTVDKTAAAPSGNTA